MNIDLPEPQGKIPSAIDYDIAYFFLRLAPLIHDDIFTFLNKIRVYLRFLRLFRKEVPHESPEASLCYALHSASSSELEILLFASFPTMEAKELVLPVLAKALIIARPDKRLYIPDEKQIETVLLETALIDETLEASQITTIKHEIAHFAVLYAQLLKETIDWGFHQTKMQPLYETFLLTSGLKTTYDLLPIEEKEPITFWIRTLSAGIASLNMLREEYLEQEQHQELIAPSWGLLNEFSLHQPCLFRTDLFIFFLIRALPLLSPYKESIAKLLKMSPGLIALFLQTDESPSGTLLIRTALEVDHLALFSPLFLELYALQKRTLSKESMLHFCSHAPLISTNLLHGFCYRFQLLWPYSNEAMLITLIILTVYDSMIKCFLQNPSLKSNNPSFWKTEQLSLSVFYEKALQQNESPLSSWQTPNLFTWDQKLHSSAPSTETEPSTILSLLGSLSFSSFWPEVDSLLKKTLSMIHVKKQRDQSALDSLVETGDALLKSASKERVSLSFLQLASEAAHNARTMVLLFEKMFPPT